MQKDSSEDSLSGSLFLGDHEPEFQADSKSDVTCDEDEYGNNSGYGDDYYSDDHYDDYGEDYYCEDYDYDDDCGEEDAYFEELRLMYHRLRTSESLPTEEERKHYVNEFRFDRAVVFSFLENKISDSDGPISMLYRMLPKYQNKIVSQDFYRNIHAIQLQQLVLCEMNDHRFVRVFRFRSNTYAGIECANGIDGSVKSFCFNDGDWVVVNPWW
jgi:hypothetical protein